tara:strand:+ start:123 stop:605 length:483 start_codon:yes stop_codon:yes gene_type:complete
MKILIIGTDTSGARLLMNGISEQGYEYLENPFKIKKHENNWFNIEKNFVTNKFVVKLITNQKPLSIPSYFTFMSQFISQFDKIILLDKIKKNNESQKIKHHKESLEKISKMIDTPITLYENLFSTDTLEQFEVVNTLGLDLDSFELQSYLDPNKERKSVL